jgi:hypothetical protein
MVSMIASFTAAVLLAQANPKDGERPKSDQEPSQHVRGFSFKLTPDGHVELTVREDDKATGKLVEKTYKADSLDEFKKKYPEVAKTYGIARFTDGGEWPPPGGSDFAKKFEDWKKHFDDRWFWDRHHDGDLDKWFKELPKSFQGDDLGKWIEEQRKLFEKFREIQPNSTPETPREEREPKSKAELGILVAPVGDTLAQQLGLVPNQGVVIAEVRKGSLAEKSGLRKHDIVVKLNEKVIEGPAAFRKSVHEALEKGFKLELIRGGKHEEIKVEPEK